MDDVIIAVVAAVAGVIATALIQLLSDSWSNRENYNLGGQWHSSSCSSADPSKVIMDRVELKKTPTGIKISNLDDPDGISYVGTAKVFRGRYLIGQWKSIQRGATNSGPFFFTISPKGDMMYGYFGEQRYSGESVHLGWCLGRTKKALNKAVVLLEDSTITQGRDSIQN
ncbi:MAG: hypothetical protein AAFW70_22255 [Cyanobacteria bacterium J06635_10]